MDYAWEYLSVAVQHELKYLTLDDHINLGNYRFDIQHQGFFSEVALRAGGIELKSFVPSSTLLRLGLVPGRPVCWTVDPGDLNVI